MIVRILGEGQSTSPRRSTAQRARRRGRGRREAGDEAPSRGARALLDAVRLGYPLPRPSTSPT